MVSYYTPERTYHALNSVPYPDESMKTPGLHDVIRAFWSRGEQMWDEDFNNSGEWLSYWTAPWCHYRFDNPRSIDYTPTFRKFLTEPDKTNREPYISEVPIAIAHDGPSSPEFEFGYQLWTGCKVTVIADRVLAARRGGGSNGIRGLAVYQQYVDEIEIAIFMSETRRGQIVAAFRVVEPFRLKVDNYSSRVRGWPSTSSGLQQLDILKNGVKVGTAYKADFSSGIRMLADTDFNTGDDLQIKAPEGVNSPGVRLGVHVSIIGELM